MPRRSVRSMCPSPSPIKATKGLPDLESLPLFKYKNVSKYGNRLIDLTYPSPRVNPRICDYVVDPADCKIPSPLPQSHPHPHTHKTIY